MKPSAISSQAVSSSTLAPSGLRRSAEATQLNTDALVKRAKETSPSFVGAVEISLAARERRIAEADVLRFARKVQAQPVDDARRERVEALKAQFAQVGGVAAYLNNELNAEATAVRFLDDVNLTR